MIRHEVFHAESLADFLTVSGVIEKSGEMEIGSMIQLCHSKSRLENILAT